MKALAAFLVPFLLAWTGMEVPSLAQGLRPRPARIPNLREVPAHHPTIQEAIRAAHDGDVVRVRHGTYREHVDFLGKAIEVVGFEGAERTILDPGTDGAVVRFHSGEGPDSRLIGFTIRRGTSDNESSAGGVSCENFCTGAVSSPTLTDCIIEDNLADQFVGGFGPGGVSGNAILERCILRENLSVIPITAGGAQGRLTLIQCVIEENEGCGVGGLRLAAGSYVLDCVLRANRAGGCYWREGPLPGTGGGIRVDGPGVVIEGSILIDNVVAEGPEPGGVGGCVAGSRGGALYGDALLERCTIVGNRWEICAAIGGIEGNPLLRNSILYSNQDPWGFYAAQAGMRFSDVEGGSIGAGSFDRFPELVDPGRGDVRLGPSSPCIDRGDPSSRADPDGTRADVGALYHPQGRALRGVDWREEEPLAPHDAGQRPHYGASVAAEGDTLLVGSTFGQGSSGSVSVLRRQGSEWSEVQRLESGTPDDGFGWSVALEGDIAAIGGLGYPGTSDGSVRIYERASPASPFVESALIVKHSSRGFGSALALDGDLLALGAGDYDLVTAGEVFLYQRLARGHWIEVAHLPPPEWGGAWLYPEFGASVDLDGNTLVVGAPIVGGDTYSGAAYVYERAGSSPFSWVLVRKLHPSRPEPHAQFGRSVSLEGDTLLVGQTSGATVFVRRGPGLPWREAQWLAPSARAPGSGSNVLLQGDRLVITGPSQTPLFPAAVWEFARENAGAPWFESARIDLPEGAIQSWRHHALAASGGSLFLGRAFSDAGERVVRRLTRGPEIDAIEGDQAADLDPITITGARLDEVTGVLVGGDPQPIVSQSPEELVILPARRAPGFSPLTLVSAESSLVLPDGFESLPSLRAESSGSGGTLQVELANGAAGAFALGWSRNLLTTPLVITSPPTWYAFELAKPRTLAIDAFSSSGRVQLEFVLPSVPALVGVPFHLQAWCQRGLSGPRRYSFSNTAEFRF